MYNPKKHIRFKKGCQSVFFLLYYLKITWHKTKIVKKSNNFISIEVNSKFLSKLEKNILICGTYIHYITSTYYRDTIFEELDADILKFSEMGTPILIMGDFNARTGNLDDKFEDYKNADQNIPIGYPFPDIPNR